jgi:hypothetical protein
LFLPESLKQSLGKKTFACSLTFNAGRAAEIIKATLSNKELYVLSRRAFDYARHNYSAGSYREKLLDIYKEITVDYQNSNLFITSLLSI